MNLNESQMAAVTCGDGPMLVLAGPGSGKTTVLTQRIKYMAEELCIRPDNILVITFTKAAANEMKTRFHHMCPHTSGVTFGTFHSVFFLMLRNAYNYTAADIVTESEKLDIVRSSIERHGFRYDSREDFARNVINEIGRVKSMMADVTGYNSTSMKQADFAVVFKDYDRYLRSRGKLDFDDMLVFTHELLSQRADILDMWRKKFRYILIDEFQDINDIQYDIVRMLAAGNNNVFAVGDDDQSVYGFRGAAPSIMKRFPEDFPGTRIGRLNINYRCSYDIVTCTRRLISHNRDRYDKALTSAYRAGDGRRVHVISADSMADQNRRIVDKICELNRSGTSYSDMAVIFRTNTEPGALVSKMMEMGIPFEVRDRVPDIFSHFLARNVFDYIKLAMGERDRATVLRVINKPNRYVSREALDMPVVDFEAVRQYYRDNYRTVNNINVLVNDLSRISAMPPYAAVNYIRKAVGLDLYAAEYAQFRGADAEEYTAILDELQESSREFGDFESWFEYIRRYENELRENARHGEPAADCVTLATMHSAKGLEFSYVFIMDAVEGFSPHKRAVSAENTEEERRLFYVAATRAKYELYIYVPQKVYGRKGVMSRFVREMMYDREALSPGAVIIHKKYGRGTITYADDRKMCVCFDGQSGVRTLNIGYALENQLIALPPC